MRLGKAQTAIVYTWGLITMVYVRGFMWRRLRAILSVCRALREELKNETR